MDISKIKLVWKYVFGGFGSVADYLLELGNSALAALKPEKKEQVQGVLNLFLKITATLNALACLCPVKWQTAFRETVEAAQVVATALEDLTVTPDELAKIRVEFGEAVAAWESPDDATCEDCLPK